MKGEVWRCFVAVPIGDELRAALAEAVEEWREDPRAEEMSWTDPASWHLTLAFLGPTHPSRVPAVRDALLPLATAEPAFSLSTGGVGGFPTPRHARVAWYGISDPERRVARLAAAARYAVGAEPGQFRPHLTLARARHGAGVDLTGWLRPETAPVGTLAIDRIVLFRSHLGRGPARYEPLAELPTGVTVRA